MTRVPAALAALVPHQQFILWTLAERDGKQIKLPIDPTTGSAVDSQNPAYWMDAETAYAQADILGVGVGFVFTHNDPFFLFDLDHDLDATGQWRQYFAGAACEISHSGEGLHIIGASQSYPQHRTRPQGRGYEFYSSGRFVALSGNPFTGDAGTDCTAAVLQLIAEQLTQENVQAAEWSTGPRADWSGPEDDDELLERALRSQSAAGVFGGRASFSNLWHADEDVLGECYPHEDGSQPYNRSSADAALLQHLAFWTGCDCERMLRIAKRSALWRDKWAREDYLPRSILSAVSNCKDVYKAAQPVLPDPQGPAAVAGNPGFKEGLQYLTAQQQLEVFSGCVYVRDPHRIFCPDGSLLKPEQFKAYYGGYIFALDAMNDKTTRNAWEAFTESQAVSFPKAHRLAFRPEIAPGALVEEEGAILVNSYVPISTPSVPGDVSLFERHLELLLPDPHDRAIMAAYMAALVQYPGVKFQWCPLLQGVEGNGKTVLIDCLTAAVGTRYTHLPNASDLGGNGQKFNAWLEGKLFIGVEEIYVSDRREVSDALKPLITNKRVEIQRKGDDQYTGDNRANFVMCSNHKDAVLKTRNDRRYAPFFTAQQNVGDLQASGMTGGYFPKLYGWLKAGGFANVTHWLQTYQIPEELNPAGACHRAPETSSTPEALALSLGSLEQEILEAVGQGLPGFSGGWISSMAVDRLIGTRRIAPAKRREMLEALGYVPHPALRDGRVNSISPIDSGKPRLYVSEGHIAANLTEPASVLQAYIEAQQIGVPGAGPGMQKVK